MGEHGALNCNDCIKLKELETLLELSRLLMGNQTLEQKATDFLKTLKSYLKLERCSIHLLSQDKKELNEYYKRAKIFCFTSEVEGYPLVFPEASFFGNYIFTTDVGGAEDITEQGKYGKIIEQNNAYKYTEELQKIIDNPIFLEEKISKIVERKNELTWSNRIRNENRIFEIFKKKGILKNEKD